MTETIQEWKVRLENLEKKLEECDRAESGKE